MVSPLMFDIMARDATRAGFDSAGSNAERFASRAKASGKAASDGLQAANANVANLAAQFQDITVQLQGGSSPLTVALQQGTQIGAVLGPLGAAGSVRALGAAFASVISPVNLVTIGAIAAAGAAYQYFSTFGSDADAAAQKLQEQDDLIRNVAKSWEEATPALANYIAQMDQAKEVTDLIAASNDLAGRQWTLARKGVADLNVELAALVVDLRAAGAEDVTILALQKSWSAVAAGIAEGKDSTKAMQDVQDSLASALAETGIPAVNAFSQAFGGLAQSIAGAMRQATLIKDQAVNALTVGKFGPELGTLSAPWSENGKFFNDEDFIPKGEIPKPGSRGTPELSGFPWEDFSGKADQAAAREAERDAERQAERIRNVMQALNDERAMITMNSVEQRTLQTQRRANVDAASEEGQAIANVVAQIDKEKKAHEAATKASEFFNDAIHDSFMEIVPAIETGNKALDTFVNKLVQASAEAIVFGTGPLAGLFSGGLFSGGASGAANAASSGSWSLGLSDFKSFEGGGYTGSGSRLGRLDGKGGFLAMLHPQETVTDHTRGGSEATPVTYAPVYNFSGTGDEVAQFRRETARREADFDARVVNTIRQAKTSGTKGI